MRADTPVVVVAGPRQAGKSTLAAHVVAERAGTWLTLDNAVREASYPPWRGPTAAGPPGMTAISPG